MTQVYIPLTLLVVSVSIALELANNGAPVSIKRSH